MPKVMLTLCDLIFEQLVTSLLHKIHLCINIQYKELRAKVSLASFAKLKHVNEVKEKVLNERQKGTSEDLCTF